MPGGMPGWQLAGRPPPATPSFAARSRRWQQCPLASPAAASPAPSPACLRPSRPAPQVLAELLQSLDDEQGTNPNALYAARRHVLAGTVLADGAVKAIKAHRQSTFKCAASAVGTGAASPADASPAATRPPAARGSQDQAGNGAPMASGGRGPPSSADSEEAAEGNLTRVLTLKDLADTPLGALGSRKAFSSGGTGELARGDSVLALGVEAHVMGGEPGGGAGASAPRSRLGVACRAVMVPAGWGWPWCERQIGGSWAFTRLACSPPHLLRLPHSAATRCHLHPPTPHLARPPEQSTACMRAAARTRWRVPGSACPSWPSTARR